MDLDFDPLFQCWGWILLINKNVYTQAEHLKNSPQQWKKISKSKSIKSCYISLHTRYMSLECRFEWMLTSSSTCRSLLKRYFRAKVPIKKLGIRTPVLLRSTADEKLASVVAGSWMSGVAHWAKNRKIVHYCVFTRFLFKKFPFSRFFCFVY